MVIGLRLKARNFLKNFIIYAVCFVRFGGIEWAYMHEIRCIMHAIPKALIRIRLCKRKSLFHNYKVAPRRDAKGDNICM